MQIGSWMLIMMIGGILFLATSNFIGSLEEKGDFESPLHISLVAVAAQGFMLFTVGILKSYQLACYDAHINSNNAENLRSIVSAEVKTMFDKLRKNIKGGVTPKTLVMLAVGFLLVGILSPIAIGTVFNATTTGWNTSVKTVFQVVLPIMYVVGCALYLIPGGKH